MKDGLYETYYENGQVKYQYWYKDDKYHRVDGPAYIEYYEDGQVSCQRWYKDGKQLTTIPKHMLETYMQTNNLTVAHLLTDEDEVVRNSASKYKWKRAS